MNRGRWAALASLLAVLAVLLLARGLRAPEPPVAGVATAGGADEPELGAKASRASRPIDAALPVRVPSAPPAIDPASPGSFEGTVVSASTGRGVAAAELTFSSSGEAVTVVGDREGRFRFAPSAAGRWILAVVTAPKHLPFAPEWGHSPVLLDARPGAHVRGIVVTLQPAEEYRGIVLDRDREPLPGVPVRVLGAAAGESALVPLRDTYVSGPDGRFTFVAPRDAVLEATRDGFAPARATVDFAAWVSRSIELRFATPAAGAQDLAAISGRVELDGGQSGGGAVVTVVRRWVDTDDAPHHAVADPDGRFTIAGLQPGRYRLRASYPGLVPATVRVEAGARDVVLRLRRGGRLAGRVRTASGEPVTPFTVVVRSREQGRGAPLQTLSVVDPAGRFEMDGLAPGPARVVVAAPGRAPSQPVAATIADAGGVPAWVDVVLPAGGMLRGVVRTRGSGAPIAEAEIEVEGQLDDGASALPVRARATTSGDGTFAIAGLPDRPVSLFVAAREHHGRIVSGIHVAEGEVAGPLEIDLSPVSPGEDPTIELVGIGAVLTVDEGALRIVRVAPGGGAAEVGLAPGDLVARVEGRAAADLDLEAAVQLIRGPEDSTVTLVVRRRNADGTPGPERTVVVPRRLVRG